MSQLRAELLKIRTTRTTIGLVLGMVALALLFTLLGGLLTDGGQLAERDTQYHVLGAEGSASLFAALVGTMLVTTELRYGTIRPTLLFEPRRERVIAAKAAAGLVAGLVLGAIAEALALGIGLTILSARGVLHAFDGGELTQLALGTVVGTALWCAIGVGFGAIVRHQVGAIIGLLAYLLIVENLLLALVPSVGRYGPGTAAAALAGQNGSQLVSPLSGALLLVAYALGLVAAGAFLTVHRDVD